MNITKNAPAIPGLAAVLHRVAVVAPTWPQFGSGATHIDTLADNTPKARRRINRLLSSVPEFGLNALLRAHQEEKVIAAQSIARRRELLGAERDALARAGRAKK